MFTSFLKCTPSSETIGCVAAQFHVSLSPYIVQVYVIEVDIASISVYSVFIYIYTTMSFSGVSTRATCKCGAGMRRAECRRGGGSADVYVGLTVIPKLYTITRTLAPPDGGVLL